MSAPAGYTCAECGYGPAERAAVIAHMRSAHRVAYQWAVLGDALEEVEHQLWLAAHTLDHDPADLTALQARRQALRLEIARLGADIQTAALGQPDAWLLAHIAALEVTQ